MILFAFWTDRFFQRECKSMILDAFNSVVQAVLSLQGENQQMNKKVRRLSVMEV